MVRKNGYFFIGDDIYSVSAEDIYTKSSMNVTLNSETNYTAERFANQMCEVTANDNDFVTVSKLYEQYRAFCRENGMEAISNANTFSKELHKAIPNICSQKKRVDGKPVNVWCYIKLRAK